MANHIPSAEMYDVIRTVPLTLNDHAYSGDDLSDELQSTVTREVNSIMAEVAFIHRELNGGHYFTVEDYRPTLNDVLIVYIRMKNSIMSQ